MFQYTLIDTETNFSIFCAYVLCFYHHECIVVVCLLYVCCWKGSPTCGECLMKTDSFCCVQGGCEPAVSAILAFPRLHHLLTCLMAFSPVDSSAVLKTRAELCRWHRNRCLILILRSEGFHSGQAAPCRLRLPSHKGDLECVVRTACLWVKIHITLNIFI